MYIVKIEKTTKTPHLYQDNTDLGEMKCVVDKKSKTGTAYRLPKNDLGREWIKGNLCYDGYEITERAPRSKHNPSAWTKYLSDEDREKLEALKAKAMERREELRKPMSEEEKLEAKIARLQKQYEELIAKKNA